MKLNSVVNVDSNVKSLINPIYEEKAISIFKRALIRFIDIIGALIGIMILIPISIYVFIERIKANEKDPLFYTQKRIGKNGNIFRLYKLNTKAPMSEFPQFINVLLGQMTLVGPRPYTTKEINKMGNYYNVIIKSKPGLTGVYQISGKRRITFEERLDLDLQYLFNASLKLNFKILLITLLITSRRDRTELYEQVIYSMPQETVSHYIGIKITELIKRIVDIIGGIVGIIVLIPITIVLAIINFFSKEKGKLFYVQERIGKNGKLFKLYKFRTMVPNADEKLNKILEKDEDARKEYKVNKKLKNDPRITRHGNFLRKSSIDELPQIINVLKGEMSLVGPRPYLLREKADMGEYYDTIIESKPGITGLWQVSGRSNTTFKERMEFDVEYNEKKSILLDIQILFKTALQVIKRDGAA